MRLPARRRQATKSKRSERGRQGTGASECTRGNPGKPASLMKEGKLGNKSIHCTLTRTNVALDHVRLGDLLAVVLNAAVEPRLVIVDVEAAASPQSTAGMHEVRKYSNPGHGTTKQGRFRKGTLSVDPTGWAPKNSAGQRRQAHPEVSDAWRSWMVNGLTRLVM